MCTVLIAEDHEDTARLLERMLRFAGFDAVAVPTEADALRLLGLRVPVAAVLDCDMLDISGLDVLRAVWVDPRTPSLPVVIYTADNSPECRAEAQRLGADEFLIKGVAPWGAVVSAVCRLAGDPPAR